MKIFIVPYRNRPVQRRIFLQHMQYILEDEEDYQIFFITQNDSRHFNRGAMKNLGFLMVKEAYPKTYKNIDLVFHDLDNLIGEKNQVHFSTEPEVIYHIFGNHEQNNIGGIFVIKAGDFEKINGFPNFWGWGWEDTVFGWRARTNNIKRKKGPFNLFSTKIVHLATGYDNRRRIANIYNKEFFEKIKKNTTCPDGIQTLKKLSYEQKVVNKKVKEYTINTFEVFFPETMYDTKELLMRSKPKK